MAPRKISYQNWIVELGRDPAIWGKGGGTVEDGDVSTLVRLQSAVGSGDRAA
jgi:hypothetical protein